MLRHCTVQPYAAYCTVGAALYALRAQAPNSDDVIARCKGAWRSSLLHPELFPQPETSGTASLTAGLAYGVSAGLLDRQTFAPAVRQAWDFLSKTALNSTGYLGHCQPNGGGPSTAPFANATTDYCVGMFLMAAVEVAAMGPGEPALV